MGVSAMTVSRWERGGHLPRRHHLKKLASVFQVSISTFYTEAKDVR
jgi:transcriptional regulator with XRE-family HTH domain